MALPTRRLLLTVSPENSGPLPDPAESTELAAPQPQPRILGIDLGTKRIGLALSDPFGWTAQPLMTLECNRPPRETLRSVARLCRKHEVAAIVLGHPLHLSGELSPRALKTQAFAAELGELTQLTIHLWDERLTSNEAHEILYQKGHDRQSHKMLVDQVAAVLILQSWLDDQAAKG